MSFSHSDPYSQSMLNGADNEDRESSEGSDSSSDDDGMIEEDEETYVKFVRSVFCDDYSGCSNTDEDDEEDYEPDNKDDDCDDDDDDRDLIRVQNRELRELVDGCWQTIVGEAPNIASIPTKEEYEDEEPVCTAGKATSAAPGLSEHPSTPPPKGSSNVFDHTEDDLDFSLLSPVPALSKYYPPAAGSTAQLGSEPTKTKPATSAISTMVTKLFSEHETSEAHIEGMPVHACRKLVARQMSMATQLLVQILLQADDRSESFTKGFSSLMELSNLREAALKKASLIQMNFHNATTIRNHTLDLRQQKLRESNNSAGSANDEVAESSDSDNECGMRPYLSKGLAAGNNERDMRGSTALMALGSASEESLLDAYSCGNGADLEERVGSTTAGDSGKGRSVRRLTRSATIRDNAVRSIFNVPILAKVSTLFDMIDLSRRNIKNRVNALGGSGIGSASSANMTNSAVNMPTSVKNLLSSPNGGGSGGSGDQSIQDRVHTLYAIKEQMYTIMPQLNMRAWRCLLPNALYPLPASLIRTMDPSTLTGRCLFTPTEDDLLLRGIMSTTESSWDQIKSFYVPSKEAQLLQFRYTQMTSISALEDNNFKKYQKLSNDYRDRDHKWNHSEELELLKGYQAFGERWPLIRVFYLPHRRSPQIRAKWFSLQKVWQKAFQSQNYKSGAIKELPEALGTFLCDLNKPSLEKARIKITALQKRHAAAAQAQSDAATDVGDRRAPSGSFMSNANNTPSKSSSLSSSSAAAAKAVVGSHHNENVSDIHSNISSNQLLPSIPAHATAQSMPLANTSIVGNAGTTVGIPGLPQMVPALQVGGQPVSQHQYPGYTMPPFMMPPWVPPGGKMPTTPAEFQAYQQSYQQYQQFMMYQYQMYMINQQQLQMQMHSMQSGLQPPAGVHNNMNMQYASNNSVPVAGYNIPMTSENAAINSVSSGQSTSSVPLSQPTPVPKSSFSDFDASGPPLLRESVQEKSKRSRKYGGVDSISSPSAVPSVSEASTATTTTSISARGEAGAKQSTHSSEQPGTAAPVSRAVGIGGASEASNGGSFWHDQDSIFSLLMPGNSIPFGEQGMSVPMMDSESGASNSVSKESSLLSRVKAANAAAPLSGRATLSDSLKAAASNPSLGNFGTMSTLTATTADAVPTGGSNNPINNNSAASKTASVGTSGVKSILVKPKKKTIKPTLISYSLANGISDMSSASPAFASTAATNSSSSSNAAFQSAAAASSCSSSDIRSNSHHNARNLPSMTASSVQPGEEQSLMGFEGFSNMNWSSAQRDGGQDSLHSPLLEDISMMDASKFAFSMPSRPAGTSDPGNNVGRKRGSSDKSDNITPVLRYNKSNNNNDNSNKKSKKGHSGESSRTKAPTTSACTAGGAPELSASFNFDENSNMSLLGDMFNDGDGEGTGGGGHGFSNLTNLLSLSSPIRGRVKSRSSIDISSANSNNDNNISHSENDRHLSENQGDGAMPSAKKQRLGGIFAEVMATANKIKNKP